MRSKLLTAAIALTFATMPVLAQETGATTDQLAPTGQAEGLDTNLHALSLAELDAVNGGHNGASAAAANASNIVVAPTQQESAINNPVIVDEGF